MEDLDAEDDGYSDDDLDALPDRAFHELQDHAVRSTQQPGTRYHVPTVDQPARLGTVGLVGGIAKVSVGGATSKPASQRVIEQPSSDYGDFDDEMLDGEIFDAAEQPALAAEHENKAIERQAGESSQREQWRQRRYSRPNMGIARHQQAGVQHVSDIVPPTDTANPREQGYEQVKSPLNPKTSLDGQSHDVDIHSPVKESTKVDTLQAQVQQLLREREALQQDIQKSNDNAFAKAGEIAIVRANAVKVEKEYESRANSLQKLHADEAARQKIEVEKARAELHKIATEKDFLENDLAEGTKQIKNLQKAIKKGGEKITGKENQVTTPKKSRYLPLRDGFDDDEVQPISPSKLALRSKANTPKAGAKRKRKGLADSPVKPLDLAQAKQTNPTESVIQGQDNPAVLPVRQATRRSEQRFQLMQKLLNHSLTPGEPRTFERFAAFAFPSEPNKPFTTIFLDRTSTLTYQADMERFPAAVCLIVISLWSQCMEENYHLPVHLLVDLVRFVLKLKPIKTAPDLTNDVMSLVQSTADVVLIPRCQKKPPRKDRADIDSLSCVQVMQMMAYDCQCEKVEISRFWRTMRFDFIMMLLNFINPLAEIHLMLSLLGTSILDNSFAMIVPPNNGQQDASEAHIVDNLSHLLINTPRPAPGENPPDAAALCRLRLEVLTLFEAMCDSTHSAESLAKHRLLIGCLVRVMNDELDRVYDHQFGHELRVELVNKSTRILYDLTTNYPHLINMQAKLSVVPGGEKKFLIALTRLAFSEGGFYEQDIEDDVVDCAHQMLEARVSPEEAEGLVEAFSSAPVSRK